MPTCDDSWTGSLRTVTDLERPDHHLLRPEDFCYFAGEYTPRAGFGASATNQLITNLKKRPSLRTTNQWPHKQRAIADAAASIKAGLNVNALPDILFIPIPPSKLPTDPEYDDRMTEIARRIGPNVREAIYLAEPRDAAHAGDDVRDWQALKAKLRLHADWLQPVPRYIALVDDMLTTGCSYRACESLLRDYLPAAPIVPIFGLFVSRRKPANPFANFQI